VAGEEPGELADVHLEEATPDNLGEHGRRIRLADRMSEQRFGDLHRRRDVTAVADAPVVTQAAARRIVEEVHARSGQQLFGFARRLALSDDEAAEVVQEALLRLWRTLQAGGSVEEPSAWTFRTAYRLAMDRHRIRRRWRDFLGGLQRGDGGEIGRGDATDQADDLLAVWAEVDRLPTRQRQVLYLHYRADLTFEAIGAVLGMEPSSARGIASRALARLRDRLGSEA
jgi:RNA polymerase sigma factor (sigma-70 family)